MILSTVGARNLAEKRDKLKSYNSYSKERLENLLLWSSHREMHLMKVSF